MKQKKLPLLLALVSLALAPQAFAAAKINSVTFSPSPAKAGQPVKVTVNAEDADSSTMCGLTVHYDDGSSEPPQRVGGGDPGFPRTFEHTYARPGSYKVKAEGKKAMNAFDCVGEKIETLVVEAATTAPAKAACPEGWGLKGKAAKDGSFSCTPKKKGADKPAAAMSCPAGTSYFVSSKALGCEKAN
jgi:hypothetical protein